MPPTELSLEFLSVFGVYELQYRLMNDVRLMEAQVILHRARSEEDFTFTGNYEEEAIESLKTGIGLGKMMLEREIVVMLALQPRVHEHAFGEEICKRNYVLKSELLWLTPVFDKFFCVPSPSISCKPRNSLK